MILRFFQETWGYQYGKTNQDNSSFFSILKVARQSQVTPTQPLLYPGEIPWPEAPLPASWRFPTAASQTWRRVFESVQIRTIWKVSAAPEASDIRWGDLRRSSEFSTALKTVGYLFVLGLYVGFMPIVIFITNVAELVDLGPMQPLWAGFAPTLGLTLFLACWPRFWCSFSRPFSAWSQCLCPAQAAVVVFHLSADLCGFGHDHWKVLGESVSSCSGVTHLGLRYLGQQLAEGHPLLHDLFDLAMDQESLGDLALHESLQVPLFQDLLHIQGGQRKSRAWRPSEPGLGRTKCHWI